MQSMKKKFDSYIESQMEWVARSMAAANHYPKAGMAYFLLYYGLSLFYSVQVIKHRRSIGRSWYSLRYDSTEMKMAAFYGLILFAIARVFVYTAEWYYASTNDGELPDTGAETPGEPSMTGDDEGLGSPSAPGGSLDADIRNAVRAIDPDAA